MLKPLLILCLGNEIVSDDGFGAEVARLLIKSGEITKKADVIFAAVAGFNLIDLLTGREKVLIVDTFCTGKTEPGTLHCFPAGVFVPANHLTASHQISLPTAMELGRIIGVRMPKLVDVVTVEPEDVETLSEELSPSVRLAVGGAIKIIREWISKNIIIE